MTVGTQHAQGHTAAPVVDHRIWEVDWTQQPTEDYITLGGDGTYGPYGAPAANLTLTGSAGALSAGIVNGTGLKFTHDAVKKSPCYVEFAISDLCTPDNDKRYGWFHLIELVNASADYEAISVQLLNAAKSKSVSAFVGHFIWGGVERFDMSAGGMIWSLLSVNDTHFVGLDFVGAHAWMRRKSTTTYENPFAIPGVVDSRGGRFDDTNIGAAHDFDRTTDILRISSACGSSCDGYEMIISRSYLCEYTLAS
jgi:hypothetical protein